MSLDGGKLSCWTVTWIDVHGLHGMAEPDDKEEVFEFLKQLEEGGQDMSYVSVFAPNTNLTLEEIEQYK